MFTHHFHNEVVQSRSMLFQVILVYPPHFCPIPQIPPAILPSSPITPKPTCTISPTYPKTKKTKLMPIWPPPVSRTKKDSDCRMICTKQKTSSPSIYARTSERDWSTTGRSGKGFRAGLSMRGSDLDKSYTPRNDNIIDTSKTSSCYVDCCISVCIR